MTMKNKTTIIIFMLMIITTILFSLKINEINHESGRLRAVISEQDTRISSLVADRNSLNGTINQQRDELERATSIIMKLNKTIVNNNFVARSYSELFFSTFKPPVSRLDAVSLALEYGNWTAEKLEGIRLTSTLKWARFTKQYNYTYVWVAIDEVTEPKTDYAPKYYEGEVFRYVWQVTMGNWAYNSYVDQEYWIDASSGEVFVTPVYYPPN
jgi:hypothetical protein